MTLKPNEAALPEIGATPRCATCGGERVVKGAWAAWNAEYGRWETETVLDTTRCHNCDAESKLEWVQPEAPTAQRIRELNDRFRTQGLGNGSVMVTVGVQAHGEAFVFAALDAVRRFDDFSTDNDPWGEHDFGAIEIEGEKLFFKLDYYDPTLQHGSENPANEGLTHRVLTLMLASEY